MLFQVRWWLNIGEMVVILVVWEGVGSGARRAKCKMTHYACTSTISGHLLSQPLTIPEPPKWHTFYQYFNIIFPEMPWNSPNFRWNLGEIDLISPRFHLKLGEFKVILGDIMVEYWWNGWPLRLEIGGMGRTRGPGRAKCPFNHYVGLILGGWWNSTKIRRN